MVQKRLVGREQLVKPLAVVTAKRCRSTVITGCVVPV